MRSSFTPPNIIAPSRPFPSGVDSVKFVAEVSNQIVDCGEKVDSVASAQRDSAERSRQVHWIVTRVTESMLSLGKNHANGAMGLRSLSGCDSRHSSFLGNPPGQSRF